jgi:hypothetical protein
MGGEMTIEAMRFAAAGKIIDDQKGLIDRLYSERDEARRLAEEFASEITRLRCNRTDTTAFSGRPKLPWEEK